MKSPCSSSDPLGINDRLMRYAVLSFLLIFPRFEQSAHRERQSLDSVTFVGIIVSRGKLQIGTVTRSSLSQLRYFTPGFDSLVTHKNREGMHFSSHMNEDDVCLTDHGPSARNWVQHGLSAPHSRFRYDLSTLLFVSLLDHYSSQYVSLTVTILYLIRLSDSNSINVKTVQLVFSVLT